MESEVYLAKRKVKIENWHLIPEVVFRLFIYFNFFTFNRSNLDPFNAFEDARLWAALESVHMKSLVQGLQGLQTPVLESTSLFPPSPFEFRFFKISISNFL